MSWCHLAREDLQSLKNHKPAVDGSPHALLLVAAAVVACLIRKDDLAPLVSSPQGVVYWQMTAEHGVAGQKGVASA